MISVTDQLRRRQVLRQLLFTSGTMLAMSMKPSFALGGEMGGQILSLRLNGDRSQTHFILDLSTQVLFHAFELRRPHQLVIDLFDTKSVPDLTWRHLQSDLVRAIRPTVRAGNIFRVVLDLSGTVRDWRVFSDGGDRAPQLIVALSTLDMSGKTQTQLAPKRLRDLLVVIDPGHGGKDPGAIGKRGTLEKCRNRYRPSIAKMPCRTTRHPRDDDP